MGKILSIISRPLKNFNVENRALRVISKEKPTAAPKHKAAVLELEQVLRDNPEIVDELAKKDPSLDSRLKDVYVSSTQKPMEIQKPLSSRYNPEKPLPLDRKIPTDFEYGIKEPDQCHPGYTTLRNILKFITDHQTDPKIHTVEIIADQYKLEKEKVSDILQFFGTFEVYIPENVDKNKKKKKTPIMAKPSNIQQLIEDDKKEEEERRKKEEEEETKEKQEKKEGQG